MKDPKVLYVPLQYFFGKDFGSEIICAYELFSRIQKRYPSTLGVVYSNLSSGKIFVNLFFKEGKQKPYFYGFLENFKFILFYTYWGIKLIFQKKPQVIHHVFPFRIGRTFNPLFLIFGDKLKKVIGPIQVSINFANKDIKIGNGLEHIINKIITPLFLFFDPIYRLLSKETLKRADKITVMNKEAKRELVEFGIPSEKIEIVPIGIDGKQFHYKPALKKKVNEFRLITVGYLIERKGTELIIKSLEEVVKEIRNIKLVIVGDGPQRKFLEDLTSNLHLRGFIEFRGFVSYPNLVSLYQESHLFVSMSRSETWGQVYIDAMACGVPVIASRTAGSEGIIRNGVGHLVKQEDYQELARKIIHLIRNKELLAEMGKRSKEEIERTYDWEKVIIPKYLKIYQELTS